jgi:hypothetical protein
MTAKERPFSAAEIGGFEVRASNAAQQFKSFGRIRLYRGIGKKFYGRSNYTHDSERQLEEFDTTFWFVLLFVPLLPLRSCRIRRKYRQRWNVFASKTYQVVDRLPRKWGQILLTWLQTALVLLVVQALGRIFVEYLRSQAG